MNVDVKNEIDKMKNELDDLIYEFQAVILH
jgi:hypothetical protein